MVFSYPEPVIYNNSTSKHISFYGYQGLVLFTLIIADINKKKKLSNLRLSRKNAFRPVLHVMPDVCSMVGVLSVSDIAPHGLSTFVGLSFSTIGVKNRS